MNNDSRNEMNIDLSELAQNINVINLHYYNDYSLYKKNNNVFIMNDIQNILNIFDDKFNQIIINIYILKKKNKITDIEFTFFNYIYDLADMLNNLQFIDQKELFDMLLCLFKIHIGIPYLIFFFANFKFKNLIDFDYLIFKINQSYSNILSNSNNSILGTLNNLINHTNLIDSNLIILESQLNFFFTTISFDFFMYYTPDNFFELIISNFNEILKNTNNINNHYKKKICDFTSNYNFLIGHKNDLVKKYHYTYSRHLQIYDPVEVDLKIKFKFNKNDIFNNFAKELNWIKNLDQ